MTNLCMMCEYSITDPMCGKCYLRQLAVILEDSKMHPLAINIILQKMQGKILIETTNEATCILCRKENLTLCRYCFTLILMNILRDLNMPEDFIRNFEYNSVDEKGNFSSSEFF